MKSCHSCSKEFTDDMVYCTECGKELIDGSLTIYCSQCGFKLGETSEKFCPNCGGTVKFIKTNSVTSKKYLIIGTIAFAILIGGCFCFREDLMYAGIVPPITAEEQYNYALYLEDEGHKSKAIKFFIKAADSGNVDAQHYAGKKMIFGADGFPRDKYLARKYLVEAANQNHRGAAHLLAILYEFGAGSFYDEVNLQEAIHWYKKAAELGVKEACYRLGEYYYYDAAELNNGDASTEEAIKWVQKSADYGMIRSYWLLGHLYTRNGPMQNNIEGKKYFELAVKNGDYRAYCDLGHIYEKEGNHDVAFKLYREGALNDNLMCWISLKKCYEKGIGVPKDAKQARYCQREIRRIINKNLK